MQKKVVIFFFLFLTFFLPKNVLCQFSADLIQINNETSEPLFIGDIQIPAGGGYDLKPITIPDHPDTAPVRGVGYNELPFSTGDVIELMPLNSVGFAWIDAQFAKNQMTLLFQAKADEGDVQVVLGREFEADYTYRIVIGGENNTKSYIEKRGVIKTSVTRQENRDAMAGIIETQDPESFPQYWVCLSDGLIIVGKGIPGDNIFMSWADPDVEDVDRVGFGSNKKEVRYTGAQILPALTTIPPRSVYQRIDPIKSEKKKIELEIPEDDTIRYGGIISIYHKQGQKELQVVPASDRVVCSDDKNWKTYWIIKGPHGTEEAYKTGEAIRKGSKIRLEAFKSRQNLNYKENVNVAGASGVGTQDNNWIIEIDGDEAGSYWKKDDSFRLVHAITKENLYYKSGGKKPGKLVRTTKEQEPDSLWVVQNYEPPVTEMELPIGTVVSLKCVSNDKNIEVVDIEKSKLGNKLNYGDNILLRVVQEVPGEQGREPETVNNFLTAHSNFSLFTVPNPPGSWHVFTLIDPEQPDSKRELKYGDIVSLVSTWKKYVGINNNKVVSYFNAPEIEATWIIIDSQNAESRASVLEDDFISFQSLDKTYLGRTKKNTITLNNAIGENESWKISLAGETKELKAPFLFAQSDSSESFSAQFRIVRYGGWVGLQSVANNKNIQAHAATPQDMGKVVTQRMGFYGDNFGEEHFIIRRLGSDYYFLNRATNGTLNLVATAQDKFKQIETNDKKDPILPAGYNDTARFRIEIISIPEIEILEATWGSIESPDKVYDVTNVVQSMVEGEQLIIPAARFSKNKFFGDPAPGSEKKLDITYIKKDEESTVSVKENQPLLLGVKEVFDKTHILNMTSADGGYFWFDPIARIPGELGFIAEFKCLDSLRIAFIDEAEQVYGTDKPLYELELGAQGNKATILYGQAQAKQLTSTFTPDIINGEFFQVWVSVDRGKILAGVGELGKNPLIAYKVRNPLNVVLAGISTGEGPLLARNFKFVPQTNLTIPPNMIEEYKQKLRTREEGRKLKLIAPFKYSIYNKERQIWAKNALGKAEPIAALPFKGRRYVFSLRIDTEGTPYIALEHEPEMGAGEMALRISSAALSGAAGAMGGGLMGAGAVSAAAAMETGIDLAYAPVNDIRTEEYKQKLIGIHTDEQVWENNAQINEQYMPEIDTLDPRDEEQFKRMIELYRKVFILIINPDNIDPVLKDTVLRDIRKLVQYHKMHSADSYNDLINLLIMIHNNPFFLTLKGDVPQKDYLFRNIVEISRSLMRARNEIELEELYGEYIWLEQTLSDIGEGAISLELKGDRDAFMCFSTERAKVRETRKVIAMYEAIVGRKDNTSIAFRLQNTGTLIPGAILSQNDAPQAMLDGYEYKKYFFSKKLKTKKVGNKEKIVARIALGQGDFKEENIILEWEDIQPEQGCIYPGIGNWSTRIWIKNIKVSKKPVEDGTEADLIPVFTGEKPEESDYVASPAEEEYYEEVPVEEEYVEEEYVEEPVEEEYYEEPADEGYYEEEPVEGEYYEEEPADEGYYEEEPVEGEYYEEGEGEYVEDGEDYVEEGEEYYEEE
jgi:tRNA-binding EMAP/Myf-like protein